jgi:hypothetical protein
MLKLFQEALHHAVAVHQEAMLPMSSLPIAGRPAPSPDIAFQLRARAPGLPPRRACTPSPAICRGASQRRLVLAAGSRRPTMPPAE